MKRSLEALVVKANELLSFGAKAQAHSLPKIRCYLFFFNRFQQKGTSILNLEAQPGVNFEHLWL